MSITGHWSWMGDPKGYIIHSDLLEIRTVLHNREDTCSCSYTFIGTGNILNFLRKKKSPPKKEEFLTLN